MEACLPVASARFEGSDSVFHAITPLRYWLYPCQASQGKGEIKGQWNKKETQRSVCHHGHKERLHQRAGQNWCVCVWRELEWSCLYLWFYLSFFLLRQKRSSKFCWNTVDTAAKAETMCCKHCPCPANKSKLRCIPAFSTWRSREQSFRPGSSRSKRAAMTAKPQIWLDKLICTYMLHFRVCITCTN